MLKSESGREAAPARKLGAARTFEDLLIFQEARQVMTTVYALTKSGPVLKDYPLRDQMHRSALSIMSNIAEGFERGSNPDFVRFLFMAKGSCGELRAQAIAGIDQEYWTRQQFEQFANSCRKLSGGISRLINYLKRSPTSPNRG
jgi:four helix bundle protein